MKPVLVLLLLSVNVIPSMSQTLPANSSEIYPFDTLLLGGYTISYTADDSLQYLSLKKGHKTISEIAATSKGLPYKNLGYKGADFTRSFVLVHSFGSGNPHYIELIDKQSGKNLLKEGAVWIDADEKQQMLLYCPRDSPDRDDKMILLQVKTGAKQYFPFPKDIFNEPQVTNRIRISKLSNTQLTIEYDTEEATKTFKR